MQAQRITYNPIEGREDNSLSFINFINFENCKDQTTQLQGLSYTPSPTNFSLCKTNQALQKYDEGRNKAVPWSNLQQLYYFDSVLRFVIENPYLTVSWAEWKPLQFYNSIAQKMAQIFGTGSRNSTQIKTKDQNLKKQYYNKSNRKIDIIKVALEKLTYFVNKSNKLQSKPQHIKAATLRYEETLIRYQEELSKMKQPKTYQLQLAGLLRFIETADGQTCKIQQRESLMNAVESRQMNTPLMTFHS